MQIGLLGERQRMNAALVLAALSPRYGASADSLNVTHQACRRGLKRVFWPGRFQVLTFGRRTVILDGAHNVEAMGELLKTLASSPWARRRLVFIVGVLRDKDVRGSARLLSARPRSRFVAVRPPSPRALEAEDLASELRLQAPRAWVRAEPDVASALRGWLKDSRPATAVVCGSFTLVGRALGVLPALGFRR